MTEGRGAQERDGGAPRRGWRDRRLFWLVPLSAVALATALLFAPEGERVEVPQEAPTEIRPRVARVLLPAEAHPGPGGETVDDAAVVPAPEALPGEEEPSAAHEQAANAGILGVLAAQGGAHNAPTSPFGGGSALGRDPTAALGALMGDQVGSNFGFGGLGTIGYGAGAGGGGGGTAAGRLGARRQPQLDREAYEHIDEVGLRLVAEHPLSTFSIDVDTASYSNVRRFLSDGLLPPPDAVRIEEMINYFEYDYAPPAQGAAPFSVHTEVGPCPWNSEARLLHVGIQGRRIDQADVPPRNLVFLLDVSGSMGSADKLPLLLSAMNLLVDNLRSVDRVAIVVYAGAAGLVLPSTPGTARPAIRDALARLEAGGSTDGGGGIRLAYDLARRHFIRGGINRVVLATDGDFNVGTTSHGDLTRLIEEQRKSDVFLSVLGFGTGNLQDHTMETLADHGNGNYAYIDTIAEARRVLVRTAGGTLVTIAKDVKLQLEFNPARVASYRLIGYDNRRLRDEEFNDDTRDAGEIGAGHSVTALYEFVPAASNAATSANSVPTPPIDPLRYQGERAPSVEAATDELATVKIRYKRPDGETSILLSRRVRDRIVPSRGPSPAFRFSAAVAAFGMVLRGSEHRGSATLGSARRLAEAAIGRDPHGDRRELIRLIDRVGVLDPDATR